MLDFNIQLPKTGESRVKAIRQIAILFRSLIESEETLVEGNTPEQSVQAFIKKQLRPTEAAMFLAFVFPDAESLPKEFEEYNIVTLSNVIDDILRLNRVMDVNDLLAFESDVNIEKIAKACGIPTRMIRQSDPDPRLMMVRRIHANLHDYERMFPTAEILLGYFAERYAYDKYSESDRWNQLSTRLDMGKRVANDDSIVVNDITSELSDWLEDSLNVFSEMVDVELVSSRRSHMFRTICVLGPQEVLKRLLDKDLITSAQFNEWKEFNDLSFAQTLEVIAAFWIALHNGEEKLSDNLTEDAAVIIDRFVLVHKEKDEDEDEDEEEDSDDDFEEDEEEEDEEDEEDEEEDEEDEDEEEDSSSAKPARRKAIVPATSDELFQALKSMHTGDEFEYEDDRYAFTSTGALRSAIFRAKQENILSKDVSLIKIGEMRHYELLELFFDELNSDWFGYGEKLQAAFEEWLENTDFKRLQFFRPLIESIVPSQSTNSFDASEAEEWLLEHCVEQEGSAGMYKFVAQVNALAAKHGIALFSVDPTDPEVEAPASTDAKDKISAPHGLMIDRVIALGVPPTKARTMSISELRAYIAEAEMSGDEVESSRSVTSENFREVIPTLSRQEIIAELASRGYSDKSLNKLGAPRLAEMFMAAMERLAGKSN